MQAIILAGGKGTRLKPFTNSIPKPLVPLGDQSILEIVLKQLRYYGVDHVTIAINHLAKLIQAFFGDGAELGLNIKYSQEEIALGTAGPVRLVKDHDENFIVMNGDLLTTINYRDFFEDHVKGKFDATIGTFRKEVKIDLGVVKIDNGIFVDYIEKPTYTYDVSMGIYVLNRRCLEFIPAGTAFDMPDLMLALNQAGRKIACYSGNYDWLDIGRVEDYEQAVALFERDRARYLPE